MSLEFSVDEKEKSQEYQWKELFYELFYEIKSEILGCKIEMEEDDYQENIRSITIPNLVNYIHDSIQILIQKKTEEAKNQQKEEDEKLFNSKNHNKVTILSADERRQYESIIKKLEQKERIMTKIAFQNNIQKEALENKITEYMEIEDEFEEMKAKLKYEDGRFLNNDRKDNEIIIVRGENSNLKKTIKTLEQNITNLENEKNKKNEIISKLQEEITQFRKKLEEAEKQNEILNSHSINININNVTGTNNKGSLSNNNTNNNTNNNINNNINNNKDGNNSSKNNNKNKIFPYQKIKSKVSNNGGVSGELLNNKRNESSDKANFLNKYLHSNKINKNNVLNNSCVKMNRFPLGNNPKQRYMHESNIHFLNNRNNMKNLNIIKRMMPSGGNSSRSSSTKVKSKPNKAFNYKSVS